MIVRGKITGLNALQAQLRRAPVQMRPALEAPVRTEARLFVQGVIKITPPASAGVTGTKAKKQGEAKVRRDIRRVYGSASDLYGLIARRDERIAKAFYALIQSGQTAKASALARRITGHELQPFDDGAAHRSRRGNRGTVRGKTPTLFTADDDAVQEYIELRQSHVGILPGGFNPAGAELGARLPAWVRRHGMHPGGIVVIDRGPNFAIRISNTAPYAQAQDMQRRMSYAQRYRQNALQRKLKAVLKAEEGRILA